MSTFRSGADYVLTGDSNVEKSNVLSNPIDLHPDLPSSTLSRFFYRCFDLGCKIREEIEYVPTPRFQIYATIRPVLLPQILFEFFSLISREPESRLLDIQICVNSTFHIPLLQWTRISTPVNGSNWRKEAAIGGDVMVKKRAAMGGV